MTERIRSSVTLACLALLAAASSAGAQGSIAPPYLVLDANPGAMGSNPRSLVRMGAVVYYAGADPEHGTELWRTDGTASGTWMVRDINPGAGSSIPMVLTPVGDTLFFVAYDEASGAELWKTDGTEAGTALVKDINLGPNGAAPGALTAVGTTLFFKACEPSTGCELWKSDGTEAGTVQVKDIWPGPDSWPSPQLVVLGDIALFQASDGVNGPALWRSDGTEAGTTQVGPGFTQPQTLTLVGSTVFFWGYDSEHGNELWKTDGTTAGTVLVKEIQPGWDPATQYPWDPMAVSGGRLFFEANDPSAGYELFVSDGTPEGTRVVCDITPGIAGTEMTQLTDLGGVLMFTPQVSGELWSSDGTSAGTRPVTNINPLAGATVSGLRQVRAEVVFAADDGATGAELWRSTGLGATRVSDIRLGIGSSTPGPVVAVVEGGDLVVFAADDGVSGRELWAVRLNRPPQAIGTMEPQGLVVDAPFTLDGLASSDPDGDALTYEWRDESGALVGEEPTVTLDMPAGTYVYTLTVGDGEYTATDHVEVLVSDQRHLVVEVSGSEGALGAVQVTPPYATCFVPSPDESQSCSYTYNEGDVVTLTPIPTSQEVFLGWTRSCSGTCACQVTIPRHQTATATFLGRRRLTVDVGSVEGGLGSVRIDSPYATCAVPGPNQAQSCSYDYTGSDVVTLTPQPAPHSVFLGWSGACGGAGACQVTMSEHQAARATFRHQNEPPAARTGGPYTGVRGEPVALNASGSTDPDGDALTYEWTFSDGGVASGPTPAHTFASLGTFDVSLTVSDGELSSIANTTVTVTTLPPSVALTSPAAGTLFPYPQAAIDLTATAFDPDGSVAKVEFFAGGVKVGEDASAPYAVAWTWVPPGSYVLTARAIDDSGASTDSAPVPIVVNASPSVSLVTPLPDQVFTAPATITVTAEAGDTDGTIARVEFYANGMLLGTDTSAPYTVTWPNVAAGQYLVYAYAFDDRGAIALAQAMVRVVTRVFASDDAFVRDGTPTMNFGLASTLEVQKSVSFGQNRRAYLKFNTSGVVGPLSSVRLRLFGNVSAVPAGVVSTQVFSVANTTWTERAITWNNRPPIGSTALDTEPIATDTTAGRWYEWDVTAYVQQERAAGRKVISLALENLYPQGPSVVFRSVEVPGNNPHLLLMP